MAKTHGGRSVRIVGLLKNQTFGKILSAVAVAIFGFILLNVVFFFDFLFQSLIHGLVNLFVPIDPMEASWFPQLLHGLFVVVIALISYLVLRSKLGVLFKASYLTVPLAVVYVTLGIFFYRTPLMAYGLSSLFGLSVLYYLARTKQPWLYYYTLVLVSLVLLIAGLTGVEI